MSWKGWIVVIIIFFIVISDPQIITQVVNALVTFINALTQGLSQAHFGSGG